MAVICILNQIKMRAGIKPALTKCNYGCKSNIDVDAIQLSNFHFIKPPAWRDQRVL